MSIAIEDVPVVLCGVQHLLLLLLVLPPPPPPRPLVPSTQGGLRDHGHRGHRQQRRQQVEDGPDVAQPHLADRLLLGVGRQAIVIDDGGAVADRDGTPKGRRTRDQQRINGG